MYLAEFELNNFQTQTISSATACITLLDCMQLQTLLSDKVAPVTSILSSMNELLEVVSLYSLDEHFNYNDAILQLTQVINKLLDINNSFKNICIGF